MTRAADFRTAPEEARRLAARTFGLEGRTFARGEQVHGRELAVVEPGAGPAPQQGIDALATRSREAVLLALGADCPGVAVVSDELPAIATAHSGWRGTVADVAPRAAEQLVAWGADRRELRAFVGPGIGPCCFEVGDEVVAAFEAAWARVEPGVVVRSPGKKPHIDLARAIAGRLVSVAGLLPERVHVVPGCTRCWTGKLFSRRRDGPTCGHHALLAWLS